jgi:cytochrome c
MTRFVFACLLLFVGPAAADDTLVVQGKALAETNCTMCHTIEATGMSPLAEAPPFRTLSSRYDAAELEDAFNDGVPTEHPAMPDWDMTPEQTAALTSFIMSLAQ